MADSNTEPALVLDDEAVSGREPVHFGGFPGTFLPGRPVAISALGFNTADEALGLVEELGLPLSETEVETGEGAPPPRVNHALGELEALGMSREYVPPPGSPGAQLADGESFPPARDPVTAGDEEATGPAAMTRAQLDEAYGDLDGYPAKGKHAEKVAFAAGYLETVSQPEGGEG